MEDLKIRPVDLEQSENLESHRTNGFRNIKSLVVRRGAPFKVSVQLEGRPFNPKIHTLRVKVMLGNLYAVMPVTFSKSSSKSSWNAYIDPEEWNPLKPSICSPASASVGSYRFQLCVLTQDGQKSSAYGSFILLCNPWCSGVRENGTGPMSLETAAFTAGTSSLIGTRLNKLRRKTFRHRDHRAQPYNRATPENRVCGEAGPSGITHTTRLQHSTPPHNDQDTERSLAFLECLSSIDLPEQKTGALCNSGESEPIFITGLATPQSEWLPRDFSDVFEYSISDFNLVHIPTTPECDRNSMDAQIDFEEEGITDSQISAAYDAYMNVADAQPAEQSHTASIVDKLCLIEAKLNQHRDKCKSLPNS